MKYLIKLDRMMKLKTNKLLQNDHYKKIKNQKNKNCI